MRRIVIIGATSAIAVATAHLYAQRGDQLLLIARDTDELMRIATDIHIRYQNLPLILSLDLSQSETVATIVGLAHEKLATIDGIVFASGYLGEDKPQILQHNFVDSILLLEAWANYFAAKKQGWLIVLTSVAGDRGRQSNYLYGAAKGGLSIYLQGLSQRLWRVNVQVINIKPGMIDTPMTFGLPRLFALCAPPVVAKAIVKSTNKKSGIIYTPWFWRWIMLIIRYLPTILFNRLAL